MSLLLRFGILGFFAVSAAGTAYAASAPFIRTLLVGSYGNDVYQLQKILNSDPDTAVRGSGSGSKGSETYYFGLLTKDAVVRYQEKHADFILIPNGLTKGTGIVGLSTRNLLNKSDSSSPITVLPAQTTPSAPAKPQSANPNLVNLEQYIGGIEKAAIAQGYAQDTIALIEKKIREQASSTVDFRAEFFKKQQAAYLKKVSAENPVKGFFTSVLALFDETLGVRTALAGLGLPFGGYITYVNPGICDCPVGITHLFVALPNANVSVSNLLLDYVDGSEAFAWYNLPEIGVATKGIYIPGVQSCWTYIGYGCFVVPAEGQITPEVGSSLLP